MNNEQWITFCLIMKWMDIFYRQKQKEKKCLLLHFQKSE